jgi:mRNA-degrading endonuclease RelE of RelBE toxin-antitoxin system
MVRVTIAPEVVRQLHALPNPIQVRLLHMVERLQHWPAVSGAKPLRGVLAGHFRMRTGDFRMQFHVRGDRIVIEKVGHREGFHDE